MMSSHEAGVYVISSSPDPAEYPLPQAVFVPPLKPKSVYYRAHTCQLKLFQAIPSQHHPKAHLPGIRLVAIPHHAESQTSEEAIEPHILPSLLLVAFAGLHTEQPATGWIVVVFMDMVAGAADGGGGEASACDGRVGDDLEAGARCCDQA